MLNNKGTYGHLGGILHSGLHALATFPILLLVVNPAFAFWLSVAEFLLHYHIDWVKMNVNKEFQLTPAKVQFWQLTGLDQYLHQLTYIGLLTISVWGHIQSIMNLSKDQFIVAVWNKINSSNCQAFDAVIEVAEANGIDMEAAGKLVNSNSPLKKLIEQQAHTLNQLKKPATSLE